MDDSTPQRVARHPTGQWTSACRLERDASGPRGTMVREAGRARALVAERQQLLRTVLCGSLQDQAGLELVGDAADEEAALAVAARMPLDVVLISERLPPRGGLHLARLLGERLPTLALVLLVDCEQPDTLAKALDTGCDGYVGKRRSLRYLANALLAAASGELAIPRDLLRGLVSWRGERAAAQARLARLTAREREVLAMLTTGAGNAELAGRLGIKTDTARTHVHNVLGKLGVQSRLAAAAFVARHELIDELMVPRSRQEEGVRASESGLIRAG